ncbi:hypothetical protein BU23DRAFT_15790 [Bimuria novae-zelandiae CBS 107.79]|uniref:Uncharacterized protein n=1 Tax=Bimuria novae-zelandiae CBS 107.79 TaxID=1447943 RepID=A0A6A5VMK1_9PLEO|nr:hypothetical protein BU23DRAFT_15790 [Bimuria novae-zelandiae CBS 107.79]
MTRVEKQRKLMVGIRTARGSDIVEQAIAACNKPCPSPDGERHKYVTLSFPIAQGLTELDRQRARFDRLDSLPAAFGVVGSPDDVPQPGRLVVLVVRIGGRWAAGSLHGRESLVKQTQILGVVVIIGVSGLRNMDQLAKQGMSDRRRGEGTTGTHSDV